LFTRSLLNKHYKGSFHTRRERLIRAFNAVKKAAASRESVSCCESRSYKTVVKFLQHADVLHSLAVWDAKLVAVEDQEEEEVEDVTDDSDDMLLNL
jgi:hypothetical protein